jgi:peroxiredoxin Q/BCP
MIAKSFFVILIILTINTSVSMAANQIKPGDKLPHFIMKNEKYLPVDISMLTGKFLVLYFYPKDDTSGCTKEAITFRDSYQKLVDAGAVVYGVSSDRPDSHAKFKEKCSLPFSLLSDTNGELRKLLGVPTDLFGLIPGRVTYVFNPEGRLLHVFDAQFSPEKHVEEALKVIGMH